ncbi:MAG TPA: tyrosine-type recombinase/integrase [Terracidiphilus sp.]|nr:tyrosine-type recombinase/integrase [Terracidiphilus sp.]
MLSVYTRHHPDCKNAGDKTWRRCSCPKWIWGSLNGKFIRQSARTHNWNEAEEMRLRLIQAVPPPALPAPQAAEPPPPVTPLALPPPAVQPHSAGEVLPPAQKRPRVTVKKAVEAYLADAVGRNVSEATLEKLTTIFEKQFLPWTQAQGFEYIDEVELDALLNFRSTWKDGALAKQKKQSRVIGFFWACVRRRYLIENPALGLGRVKVVQIPTDYFPPDEFQRILDATETYGDPRGGFIPIEDLRIRLRAMTVLMRWSGLRIRDAIILERHRLHGDSLLLYQAKTGTPVYVPLPPHVVGALESLPPGPKPNPRYFFWSGNGKPKSAVANWQRAYRRLFELANIRRPDGELKRCHPHMFRDTFAVEMLLAGVPIDQVSLLLGHASVKITEKSYAPFVKARQLQLQESVRNAWNSTQPPSRGPENGPPVPSVTQQKHSGWQVIRSQKKTGTG